MVSRNARRRSSWPRPRTYASKSALVASFTTSSPTDTVAAQPRKVATTLQKPSGGVTPECGGRRAPEQGSSSADDCSSDEPGHSNLPCRAHAGRSRRTRLRDVLQDASGWILLQLLEW